MTEQKNNIPIKGYATFDPLKHCLIGSGFKTEWFSDLDIYKNDKIMDPLKRIADETEEDFQILEKILKQAGVKTYRSSVDIEKLKALQDLRPPPVTPRDYFAVIGEKIHCVNVPHDVMNTFQNTLDQIDKDCLLIDNSRQAWKEPMSTANIVRIGKRLLWDMGVVPKSTMVTDYIKKWQSEGFEVITSNRGYHSDGCFCVVKPGCIVSLHDVQDYKKEFPGWDVLYLQDQGWKKVYPFLEIKKKVKGRWWLEGEEHNDQFIQFVNTWLNDWVGYVEETVFDVNMLSIDQNTIVCNNYNKEVFDHFKKHKVEPVIFHFRHRFFWDGGVHCVTQDLYREGKMEDYFG